MGIVQLVVDIVACPEFSLAAAEIRIAHHIYLHRLEVQLGGGQISLRTHLVRAGIQSAAGYHLPLKVNAHSAVERIER